jgi:Protein of unknown function DUF262
MIVEIHSVNFNDDIAICSLSKWLDYASGFDESVFVALPLIQRGSVWKPKQIIDLWNTLLRGMPLGSMMFSPMPAGIEVRKIDKNTMEKTPSGAIGLIDGQQRTLAMLIAWKIGESMDRRIWVDFADKPSVEHLFRLHITTKNQPFGFQKASPNSKLSLSDRRKALTAFIEKTGKTDITYKPSRDELFIQAKPFDSKYPLDLFSITRLKPPASSRLASADKMTRFEVCHGLQVWQSYGFSN